MSYLFFYKLSTNEKGQHGLCSSGDANWCKFKKGACSGVAYEHKYSLPPTVMNAIKPLLRDRARVDLPKGCLHGKNQNSNKSLNSVILTRIHKTVIVRKKCKSSVTTQHVFSFIGIGHIGLINPSSGPYTRKIAGIV